LGFVAFPFGDLLEALVVARECLMLSPSSSAIAAGVFGDAVQLYGDFRDAIPANDPVAVFVRCGNSFRRSKGLILISVCSCPGYVLFCRAQARIRASSAFF